jgi:hypothetical protein
MLYYTIKEDKPMGTAINLDTNFVNDARTHAKVESRSAPKQIEHWAIIGRIAEENPELNYAQIKNILLGLQESKDGKTEVYKRGSL